METSAKNNTFQLTTHSALRAQQRGVCAADITFVLEYAKPLHKQGMKFFSLKNMRKNKKVDL